MPGYDVNRFVDLNEREAKHYCCGICLNIFDNAITTLCGHNFCKDCIRQSIVNRCKECPNCRTEFRRKRSHDITLESNLVIVFNYVFSPNYLVNSIISEFKIKCNFAYNGCLEVVELRSLSDHLDNCGHRICQTCKVELHRWDTEGDHNCIQTLKFEMSFWKTNSSIISERLNISDEELSKLKDKNKELEDEVKQLKAQVDRMTHSTSRRVTRQQKL